MEINFENSKNYFKSFSKLTIDNGLILVNNYLNNLANKYRIDNSVNNFIGEQRNTINDENEYKKTTYYNIKSIHDDLIATNLNRLTDRISSKSDGISNLTDAEINEFKSNLFYNSRLNSENCNTNNPIVTKKYDLYQIFQIVDRGNNNIGNKVVANLSFLYDTLSSDFIGGENDPILGDLSSKTIYALLSSLAESNGFWFQQIPNYINLNSSINVQGNTSEDVNERIGEVVDQMFGVHKTTKKYGEGFLDNDNIVFGGILGFPGYIFQLGNSSSTLTNPNRVVKNNFTDSFCLDIHLDENNLISPMISKDAPSEILNSESTSCFTIDFGRQNQQMFNNVSLDTSQFGNTEYAILAWTQMINSSYYETKPKNIFPIMERYMYSCEVSGLGNATIQPLNYFYLRNVPLFTGTYWITNVKHSITPNNMTTTFRGVRQPILTKNDVRKLLIKNFVDINSRIRTQFDEISKVKFESLNRTGGVINKNESDLAYGTVSQLISGSVNKYQEYDGMTVIGSYIAAVCGGDNLESNKLMIAYLYNLAKSTTTNQTHANIISKMIDVVIIDMQAKIQEHGDKRFISSTDGTLSLYVLLEKATAFYGLNGALSELLTNISVSLDRYNELITLSPDTPVFGLKAVKNDDVNSPIDLTNSEIVLTQGTIDIMPRNNERLIQKANICLDLNISYKAQEPYTNNKDFNYTVNLYDIFNTYNSTNSNEIKGLFVDKTINLADKKQIEIKKYLNEINIESISKNFLNMNGSLQVDSGDVIKIGVAITIKKENNDSIYIAPLSNDKQLFPRISGNFTFDPLLNNVELVDVGDDMFFKLKYPTSNKATENVTMFNLVNESYGYQLNSGEILPIQDTDTLHELLIVDGTVKFSVEMVVFLKNKITRIISNFIHLSETVNQYNVTRVNSFDSKTKINTTYKEVNVEVPNIDTNETSIVYKYLGTYDNNVAFFISNEQPNLANNKNNIKEGSVVELEPKKVENIKNTKLNNMTQVKNFLKNYGLSKAVVAGIMGNIEKESRFNPEALNGNDNNGYPSYGLIQWNKLYYNFDEIGKTVDSQMKYLTEKTPPWKKFVKETSSINNDIRGADEAAYQFARLVEICASCNLGKTEYYTSQAYRPYERSRYAMDIYNLLNDENSLLPW